MSRGITRARTPASGRIRVWAATAAALLLAAGCGGNRESVSEAAPYLDPGYVEAAGFRLHYALTLSTDLPAAIAGGYGIQQRANRAVLTVAIASLDAAAGPALAGARAEATAISLTGARTPLALTRRGEPGGATWIGTADVQHRVPITIEIVAHATSDGPPIRARLTREFRLE